MRGSGNAARSTKPILSACLALLVVLAPASALRAEDELTRPYQLEVVLHVADHPLLTPVFRDRVARELRDGLQAALGNLGEVRLVTKHPRLKDVLERGLQKSLDSWQQRSAVKTHFVLVSFSGADYAIQARQHDGVTGQSGPVVRSTHTRDRDFVAKATALLIKKDFGLLGTVSSPPTAQGAAKMTLQGGGRGVSMRPWVQKDDVFALVQVPAGPGRAWPVKWAYLQVTEPPADRASDGVCQCRFLHRYNFDPARVAGLRCIKLGTTRAPLHLHFVREGADGLTQPLDKALSVEIRRHGFQGMKDLSKVTDGNGDVDTSGDGSSGLFQHIAFVSVKNNTESPIAKVPVPIVGDETVTIAVTLANEASGLIAFRLAGWRRSVSESLRVQNNLFREIQKLAAKAEGRTAAMSRAEAGLKRSRTDRERLAAEAATLQADAQKQSVTLPDLAPELQRLNSLREGEAELERFVTRLKEIEKAENDPERRKLLEKVVEGKMREREAEIGKALEIYRDVLARGLNSDELKKHVAELSKLWQIRDPSQEKARTFIYDVWPTLTLDNLKANMDTARAALETCKQYDDVFAARRLLLATDAHAERLAQKLDELRPENEQDEKPLRQIREVTPELIKLGQDVRAYLSKPRK